MNGELGLDENFALGIGITPFTIGDDLMLIPVRFSWLSNSTRGLYLGGGLTFLDTDSGSGAVSTLTWGVQKDFGTGDYIRVTFTHFGFFETVGTDDEIARIPWPGVAVGGAVLKGWV